MPLSLINIKTMFSLPKISGGPVRPLGSVHILCRLDWIVILINTIQFILFATVYTVGMVRMGVYCMWGSQSFTVWVGCWLPWQPLIINSNWHFWCSKNAYNTGRSLIHCCRSRLWNNLPVHLHDCELTSLLEFHRLLKTHVCLAEDRGA